MSGLYTSLCSSSFSGIFVSSGVSHAHWLSQIMAFNYDERTVLTYTSPCFSVYSCFLLYSPTCNYRAGSDAVQWLWSKAAQCLQLGATTDLKAPVCHCPESPAVTYRWRSEACLKQWACDSCVGGGGKLQAVDSHSIFLSGQPRVNFSSHRGYLLAFEGLITHEADKFKLYLLPGRLAVSQASEKYPLSSSDSSGVCFPLQKTQVPVLAWMCR